MALQNLHNLYVIEQIKSLCIYLNKKNITFPHFFQLLFKHMNYQFLSYEGVMFFGTYMTSPYCMDASDILIPHLWTCEMFTLFNML